MVLRDPRERGVQKNVREDLRLNPKGKKKNGSESIWLRQSKKKITSSRERRKKQHDVPVPGGMCCSTTHKREVPDGASPRGAYPDFQEPGKRVGE